MDSTVVPPQEPAAVSMSDWRESFWRAVNEHGWRYALKEIGWRPALRILGALVVTGFAEFSKGTASRPAVRSTGDVTRQVLDELDVTPPPTDQAQPPGGDTQASSVSSTAGPERLLEKLEQRERAERDSLAARLAATKGRERILYAAHLLAALLAVVLAFSAVGLVLVGLVPVAVASAAVAIIPGSGTFLLRKMWDKERAKQEILEASRNEHAAIVDAVEGALSLPDSRDRNRLVTQLAERLVQRAFAD